MSRNSERFSDARANFRMLSLHFYRRIDSIRLYVVIVYLIYDRCNLHQRVHSRQHPPLAQEIQ